MGEPGPSSQAQTFPVAGEIFLSFSPTERVSSANIPAFTPFQLWVLADIPVIDGNPDIGIAGIEGGITFPPSITVLDMAFAPPALMIDIPISETGLRSFVVGLGTCYALGAPQAFGTITAMLTEVAGDVEIGVDAPSVNAAGISSFAGIGPGWASNSCSGDPGYEPALYLFAAPTSTTSNVIVNPTVIGVEASSLARIKALY